MFQQNHGFFAEWPNGGPPQGTDMAKTAQSAPQVAGERAYIGTLSAFGLKNGMVQVSGADKVQPADLDRACAKFHRFAVACQVVGPLALDLDRRITRRHLLDAARKGRQKCANCISPRSLIAPRNHSPFGIISIPFLAPADREPKELAAVHYERDRFGCLTKCNRQRAGRERIKRAGVAGSLGIEQPLHDADRVGRRHANRLVEHDPAVHVALLALFLFWPLSVLIAASI